MANSQIQEQREETSLRNQAVSRQRLLMVHLAELAVGQLSDRINAEIDDNPALEMASHDDGYGDGSGYDDSTEASGDDGDETFDAQRDREDRQTALDEALEGLGRDEEDLPVYHGSSYTDDNRHNDDYAAALSFYDLLREQISDVDISVRKRAILEYLIGSLDGDGFLRKDLGEISDELAIYQNINADIDEITDALATLQQFDPAGIGARDLRECILLQLERRPDGRAKDLLCEIVEKYYDLFADGKLQRIAKKMKLADYEMKMVMDEVRKLNPRPGASLGAASSSDDVRRVTPDFIVDTNDDGTVTFSLNNGDLPEVKVSQSFIDTMNGYKANKGGMNRQAKEALLYTSKKVESAKMFINALKERNKTLTSTMAAIIRWQKEYFEDGDESLLRPMKLADIANLTGYDTSTISRVSRSKYVQTRWGIFPLKHFFVEGYTTGDGEELSTKEIKRTIKEIVDGEDKKSPLSDDQMVKELKRRGFPIARRTVAKYREQMGIPIARLRR